MAIVSVTINEGRDRETKNRSIARLIDEVTVC